MNKLRIELMDLMYRLDKIEEYLNENNIRDQDYWDQYETTRNAILNIYNLLGRYDNNPYINVNIQNISQIIQGFTGIVNELEHELGLNKRMQ